MRQFPDFSYEKELSAKGSPCVAGVDEVGRGPLAGPVHAAAVVLNPDHIPTGLQDSKTLSARRRDELCDQILEHATVSVALATVEEIDAHNILRASHIAMVRAIDGLRQRPDHVLVDGNMLPAGLDCPATAVVKGDARCLSIAAASIVAKVARDRIMVDLAQQFPGYGWDTNMGYPTAVHLDALKKLGVTQHHRRSFKPVHNILYQVKSVSN